MFEINEIFNRHDGRILKNCVDWQYRNTVQFSPAETGSEFQRKYKKIVTIHDLSAILSSLPVCKIKVETHV